VVTVMICAMDGRPDNFGLLVLVDLTECWEVVSIESVQFCSIFCSALLLILHEVKNIHY
jgi:hypothetical protein